MLVLAAAAATGIGAYFFLANDAAKAPLVELAEVPQVTWPCAECAWLCGKPGLDDCTEIRVTEDKNLDSFGDIIQSYAIGSQVRLHICKKDCSDTSKDQVKSDVAGAFSADVDPM
jgi:hypothetical protein